MNIRESREWQATPRWENIRDTNALYNAAAELRECGIPATVDHIYPLAGENVCGLHWHKNMQLVPADINAAKGTHVLMVPVYEKPAEQLGLF